MNRKYVSIPIEIWNLSELHPNERVLLAEVASFEQNGKQCFMSNEHLAEFLHVSEATARRYISNLIEGGFLIRTGNRYDRRLLKNEQTNAQNCAHERSKLSKRTLKNEQTSAQKCAHTNTYTKPSTKRITKSAQVRGLVLPFDTDEFRKAWAEWLDYKRTDHRFKYKSEKTEQRALKTLQNEYTTESACIKAIHTAIANGWKGLVFDSSKSKRTHRGGKAAFENGQLQHDLRELARTGHIQGDNRNRL